MTIFSGGDFFFPELRSGDGLASEVEGDGEGGLRGAGELLFGLTGSDLSELAPTSPLDSSGTDILNG